jgi:iron-regulated transporter 1
MTKQENITNKHSKVPDVVAFSYMYILSENIYWQVLRIWLVTQNFSFIIAGCTVITLLFSPALKSTNFTVFILLVILTNISGAIGVLSTLAGTILIEREW